MNNKADATYYPKMKTAASNFRFERTTLKKRLDKYQEQHSKTLREILQNQKDLTRSLSLESEQPLDKNKILCRRRACSLYGTEPHGDSIAVGQQSVTDTVMLYSKYDRRTELPLSYPVKNQTNGKLNASSFLPSKPRSASFVTSRSCSSARSNSVAEGKTCKKVLRRQERIENSQETEIQKSLIERTKNMIIADQERSLRSSKVNKDALKDQKHDKHKMNLTEKSQQTTSKRSVNSSDEYKVKTTEQKDKEKSILNLFKNKNPLAAVSKQNANSPRQAEQRDNNPIKSVNDISRTILEPASVIIKHRLRPTKSLSPIGTRNTTAMKNRSKTFTGETEIQGSYPENPLVRKQVDVETKNANPNEQYLQRCHRNAWSKIDNNFTEKTFSKPNGETSTPSLKMSLTKQSDVKKHLSSCTDGDKTLCNSTEKKEIEVAESYELPTIETPWNGSEVSPEDNQRKKIRTLEQRNETVVRSEDKDHVMYTTPTANQISGDNSETDCHSQNKKDTLGNGSEDNHDSRNKKANVLDTQSKGWRKLRAIPLKRLREIGDMREAALPVLQDFQVRDSRLPDRPGLMSFRQVVLAAIKKEQQQANKKGGKILVSKERLHEIQQPTESFLRQTVDKKIMHYITHAPRPPTEERPNRGPEFHAVAKGIQGFQTLSSVVNANRLLRAEKIRKKSALPYTRTQDLMANGHKTTSEMMEEVKHCRYLRNKEYVT